MSPACLRASSSSPTRSLQPAMNPARYPARFDRFDRECTARVRRRDPCVTSGSRIDGVGSVALPVEFGVALVVRDHGPQLASTHDGPAQKLEAMHAAVRVTRAVQPHQPRVLGPVVGLVRRQHGGSGDHRADGVRRVRDRGNDDHVARAETQEGGQQPDELLRSDRREGVHGVERDAASSHASRRSRRAARATPASPDSRGRRPPRRGRTG